MAPPKSKSLTERLQAGEFINAAEGYVFEFERRCYLQAGPWVPVVVLERPHLVKAMHEEFVHAGADVVEAFTYYGHREKLRLIGRENDLEQMNREALRIAREVADETGTLMAGNICNTTCYDPDDPKTHEESRRIFKECIEWAVEGGADFIVAETFSTVGEASLALQCIKEFAPGKESVIMLAQHDFSGKVPKTQDGYTFPDGCQKLHDEGATVVGLNCSCGPKVMIDIMRTVRERLGPKAWLAALPVPYRTDWKRPQMQNLVVPATGKRAFPYSLDMHLVPLEDIQEFGKACKELNIQYTGLCCGNCAKYTRELTVALGKKCPAERFSPAMHLHYYYGTSDKLHKCNTDALKKLIDSGLERPLEDLHTSGK